MTPRNGTTTPARLAAFSVLDMRTPYVKDLPPSAPTSRKLTPFILSFVSIPAEPWRDLPPSMAEVLEPELPAITHEILLAIADEVPEYAQPLESAFGEALRGGVDEALRRFVILVRDPDSVDDRGRRASVALGRAELHAGRTLDALQAAYRVGARVAWRRLATATQDAGVDQTTAARLAEAIFAYIDGLSADSVEGYAQAQSNARESSSDGEPSSSSRCSDARPQRTPSARQHRRLAAAALRGDRALPQRPPGRPGPPTRRRRTPGSHRRLRMRGLPGRRRPRSPRPSPSRFHTT